jgi:hypothetical protein
MEAHIAAESTTLYLRLSLSLCKTQWMTGLLEPAATGSFNLSNTIAKVGTVTAESIDYILC